MPASPSLSFPVRRRRWLVLGMLAAGVACSVGGWQYVARVQQRQIEGEFNRRAIVQVRLAQERLQLHAELVRGIRAYIENSSDIRPHEFAAYTGPLLARLPAARTFQWAPRVPATARADFEAAQEQLLDRKFYVWERETAGQFDTPIIPARPRDEYWPIACATPLAGNEISLGFDLHESVITRPMLDAARHSRQLRLSPQVRLIRDAGNRGSGVIFIEPVFQLDNPLAGPDGFIGFIQAIFRVDALLGEVHHENPDEALDLAYYDDTAQFPELRLLYARMGGREFSGSADNAKAGRLAPVLRAGPGTLTENLRLGERSWRLRIAPNARWLAQERTPLPSLVLGGLLLLTAISALFVHNLLSRTARTEREIAERTAELRESRRQLAGLLADMPGMAYRCAPEPPYRPSLVSEGVLLLTGLPAGEFLADRHRWNDLIHADDLALATQRTDEALAAHLPFEVEYRVRHTDGSWRHVWERGHGVYDEAGVVQAVEGLVVDATARQEAEARARETDRQLLEARRLESLGVLAGGIAHDFNNILTSVLGNASLLRLQLDPDHSGQSSLEKIELASRRAADLCKQMLAYAGKGRLVTDRIDLGELVRGTVTLLEVSLNKNTRIDLRLASRLPPVLADGTQLRQIVMNLVINAADAIGPTRGLITVTTFACQADELLLRSSLGQPDLPPGAYVGLEVKDSGCGMSPETIARIFEPFFTTKFSGRGLGLSAVLGIVQSHGGALFVESQPGQGATFRLLLPAAQGVATLSAAPFAVSRGDGAALRGTVLVIDDEEAIRSIVATVLGSRGANVLVAANGEEGARVLQAHAATALVLLDMTMPGLSGDETLRLMRQNGADQPVILMSGYSEAEALRLAPSLGTSDFIQKPFEIATLVAKVRPFLS